MKIRSAKLSDAPAICEIYNYYVTDTVITFQEDPVSVDEIRKQIKDILKQYSWLVIEDELVLGYAFFGPWKERSAYRHTVESTIYLRAGYEGRGLGTQLYRSLFDAMKPFDNHAVVGCIALPNPASILLHEKFGFKKVAHFKEVGFKFGEWIDVGYWEKMTD